MTAYGLILPCESSEISNIFVCLEMNMRDDMILPDVKLFERGFTMVRLLSGRWRDRRFFALHPIGFNRLFDCSSKKQQNDKTKCKSFQITFSSLKLWNNTNTN